MDIEAKLTQLGLTLPTPPKPVGNYVGSIQVGNLLFMSGCGPRLPDNSSITGKLGQDMTIEQGYDAARLVALNMLANVKAQVGSLDRIQKLVKVLGMVNCTPDFNDMPKVINGFSDLMVEVLGTEVGQGARSAVGLVALPFQIAVEVEAIFQITD